MSLTLRINDHKTSTNQNDCVNTKVRFLSYDRNKWQPGSKESFTCALSRSDVQSKLENVMKEKYFCVHTERENFNNIVKTAADFSLTKKRELHNVNKTKRVTKKNWFD